MCRNAQRNFAHLVENSRVVGVKVLVFGREFYSFRSLFLNLTVSFAAVQGIEPNTMFPEESPLREVDDRCRAGLRPPKATPAASIFAISSAAISSRRASSAFAGKGRQTAVRSFLFFPMCSWCVANTAAACDLAQGSPILKIRSLKDHKFWRT